MAAASEAEIDSAVSHALSPEPLAEARLDEQVDRSLFQHAGANAFDDVLAAAALHDDGVDSFQVQQMAQQQAGRSGAHEAHLRPQFHMRFTIVAIVDVAATPLPLVTAQCPT